MDEQALRAAWFYYKADYTQDEIAKRMSVSRASVGRMLERARKEGLVTISLVADHLASTQLALELAEAYGLSDAVVVPHVEAGVRSSPTLNAQLGQAGTAYLTPLLRAGSSVGVGWGDTVSHAIAAIDLSAIGEVTFVTLTGGVDGYLQALAYSRGGREAMSVQVIPSPIVASTPDLATALRSEPIIRRVIATAQNLRLAVVGVGTAEADSTLVQMGYLSRAEALAWTKRGCVGDILGQFFDANGVVLDLPIHQRRIGVDLEDLRGVDKVVGVAGGLSKVEAIRGALSGAYLDVLVTDEAVAKELIARSP